MDGLGDLVAKVTEVTGIKYVVEAVAPKGCGCAERQAMLNQVFPFGKPKEENNEGQRTDSGLLSDPS